jgi:hypothetical protein
MRSQAAAFGIACLCGSLGALDSARQPPTRTSVLLVAQEMRACAGERPATANVMPFELQAGAFPGSGHPDVAVHVPPRFDGTRRPGLILYFHGWNGCVDAALADDDVPCADGGEPRPSAALAAQVDRAGVNALLIAIELRVDAATGEPGQLAMPGGLRDLLRELFATQLAERLGCTLAIDALDRVLVIAHSGGYQAAASVLRYGDVPQIREVDVLDGLYGAEEIFAHWVGDALSNPSVQLRFVDLYTTSGGTRDRSRALSAAVRNQLGLSAGTTDDFFYDNDNASELPEAALSRAIVFQRVWRDHSELPRAYVHLLVKSAGFAPIAGE